MLICNMPKVRQKSGKSQRCWHRIDFFLAISPKMNPSMKSKVYTALIYHIMSILSFFFNFYFAFYSIFDNILLSWTWENQSIISPLAKKICKHFFAWNSTTISISESSRVFW